MAKINLNKKRNLCEIHKDIEDKVKEIIAMKPNRYDNVDDFYKDVEWLADDIYTLLQEAIERGNAMEGRLQDYRYAIEGLGFKREKNE